MRKENRFHHIHQFKLKKKIKLNIIEWCRINLYLHGKYIHFGDNKQRLALWQKLSSTIKPAEWAEPWIVIVSAKNINKKYNKMIENNKEYKN